MKKNTSFRLPLSAASYFSVVGALILAASPNSAMSQDAVSTTTVTTQPTTVTPPVSSTTTVTEQPVVTSPTASSTTTVTTQPAPVPAVSSIQTTTVTTVVPTSLYISKRHGNSLHDGEAISTRRDGKVYDSEGVYVGHLTNLNGNDISAIPTHDEFKIRNSSGSVIASTRPSSAYDSDRKVLLSTKDVPVPLSNSSTTTTHQTTTTQ